MEMRNLPGILLVHCTTQTTSDAHESYQYRTYTQNNSLRLLTVTEKNISSYISLQYFFVKDMYSIFIHYKLYMLHTLIQTSYARRIVI